MCLTPKGLGIPQQGVQKHVSDLQTIFRLLNLYTLYLKQAKAKSILQFSYHNSLNQ